MFLLSQLIIVASLFFLLFLVRCFLLYISCVLKECLYTFKDICRLLINKERIYELSKKLGIVFISCRLIDRLE